MTLDAGLFAEVAAAPDDAAPYLILADALQQRGDPRGDLIALQHALETAGPAQAADLRRREAELLEAHAPDWTGPLWDHREQVIVQWRRGFVHAARILLDDDATTAAALDALLAAPHIGSTLAELRLGPPRTIGDARWPSLQPLVDALVASWPSALRRLYLGEGDLRGLHGAPHVGLREVLGRAGRLDTLVVQAATADLPWRSAPPALRRLDWCVPGSLEAIRSIATWPALEQLVVWAARPDPLTWLSTDRFPGLRRLGLAGATNADAFCHELVALPLVARLEHLEVSGGTLTLAGARVLQPLAARLALDLRRNAIARPGRDELAADGIEVATQRSGARALTEHVEVDHLSRRFIAAAERFNRRDRAEDLDEPGAALRRYRNVAGLAQLGDPRWEHPRRLTLLTHLADADARPLRSELAEAIEAEPAALWATHGAQLYVQIGSERSVAGELYDAEPWLWRALTEARWFGQTSVETDALANLASVRMRRGDPRSAAPLLEQVAARYRAQHASSGQLAWTLRMQGNVELVRSDFPKAERFYNEAIALYRSSGERDSEAIVLGELAGVLWGRQDFAGAEELTRQSIAMRDLDSLGSGSAHRNLGALLNALGRIDEAIAAAQHSLAVFRKHAHRGGEGQALSLLGELYQRSNEPDRARDHLEQALVCDREIGALREEGVTLGHLSRVALDRGDHAAARAYCEQALECHRSVGNRYNEGLQLLGLADAAIGERDLDEALARAEQALVPLEAIGNLPAIAAVRMRFGFVAQLRRDFDAAERAYRRSIGEATRGNYPELVGWNEMWLGVLAAQRGQPREAYGFLGRAGRELGKRARSRETLEMATAVVARLGGNHVPLLEPRSWDARLLASLIAD